MLKKLLHAIGFCSWGKWDDGRKMNEKTYLTKTGIVVQEEVVVVQTRKCKTCSKIGQRVVR